ncbi:unnamed protein product [Ceutorhynchus assimilis]|uniref:C2H2-type domain-containing protein n=1 Tax=Ceutorhynchus assimilis TaxID=467358 RepID=A0A9N9MK46_9CUCU|nr:unnamed protein product [Ceutorhynchus assimilis]
MNREDFDEGPAANTYNDTSEDEDEPLIPVWKCLDCVTRFPVKQLLYEHLLDHIKQPVVEIDIIPKLERISSPHPPLKLTLKTNGGDNKFEIVTPNTSPSSSDPGCTSNSLDEVSTEAAEFDGKHEENYEEDFYKIDEVNDELEIKDQAGSPFDNGEIEGEDSRSSIGGSAHSFENLQEENDEHSEINFSPNLAEVIGGAFLADINSPVSFAESPTGQDESQGSPREEKHDTKEEKHNTQEQKYNIDQSSENHNDNTAEVDTLSNGNHATSHHTYGGIPGAEPTPPPEPSPTGSTEYPKIKIKTTGLFKDPEPRGCTITEITDDNPTGESSQNNSAPVWTTPSLDDPLKLPDSDSLLSMFNERNNKDLGYSSNSDNEFISLDTFNERNRGQSMQLYNPNNAVATTSSLQSIAGLPMQALAQQVSRMNPGNGQGLHQQNVLINIQQFPTPPQAPYPPQQHQHYPPHYPPPHPGQNNMHQPYQYQPAGSMYPGFPAPGYPQQHPQQPHMQPPQQHQMGQMQQPQHQMGQMQQLPMGQQPAGPRGGPGQQPNNMGQSSQGQTMPPPNQIPQPPNSMQSGYRPPMAPGNRPPNPRGGQPGGMRMPGGNQRPLMNQRAPNMRPRAPMVRPRGAGALPPMRGQMRPRMGTPQNGIRPGQKPLPKRNTDQNAAGLQTKRKRLEVLPNDDDDDCQVIFTQPKNTGLQIEHIQGASEAVDNAIMKLPDSITLSVRPPAPKSASSPQKSEAKAVANVLASRGITVTPSAKPKEAPKQASPTAMSLNGAVSIVPPSKGGAKAADGLPTVDLTDDAPSDSANRHRPGLPYRCDLCPATYPNAIGLNKHRQTYHKTTSGMSELGIPLINLKQPGIMQKLSQFGVNHYIPMPSAGPGGTYAIPIINSKTPGAMVSALDSTQMLTLGPVRNILRAGVNSNTNTPGKK